MANNNLNAADIDGCTIASLLCQRFTNTTDKDSDPKDVLWKIPQQAILNLQNQDIEKNLRLLILDEVSNIRAQKIGQSSRLFGIGKNNSDAFRKYRTPNTDFRNVFSRNVFWGKCC